MRSLALVSVLSSFVAHPTEAQTSRRPDSPAPDAISILERASVRYETLQGYCADFRQILEVTLLNEVRTSSGELCWMRPNRFEMLWSDPAGDRVVADGIDLWLYNPSEDEGQVFRTTLAEAGQSYDLHREFLANPGERYDAVLEGQENVGGNSTYRLSLTPIGESPYDHARIWIDTESDLLRQLEIHDVSVRMIELTNTRLDPDLTFERFEFEVPPGVQVIAR